LTADRMSSIRTPSTSPSRAWSGSKPAAPSWRARRSITTGSKELSGPGRAGGFDVGSGRPSSGNVLFGGSRRGPALRRFRVDMAAGDGTGRALVLSGDSLVYERRRRRGRVTGGPRSKTGVQGVSAAASFNASRDGSTLESAAFEAPPGSLSTATGRRRGERRGRRRPGRRLVPGDRSGLMMTASAAPGCSCGPARPHGDRSRPDGALGIRPC